MCGEVEWQLMVVLLCPMHCRRWLEYEEAHGSAADVEGVKQRAMDYMRAQETA
jgi:hypothetical protein